MQKFDWLCGEDFNWKHNLRLQEIQAQVQWAHYFISFYLFTGCERVVKGRSFFVMCHEFYLTYFHGNKFDSDVSFKTYGDMKKYSGAVVSCFWPLFYLICIVGKYLPTPNINSGLIQSHKHFWWSYTRGTYIRNHCRVWSFSHLLFVSQEREMK